MTRGRSRNERREAAPLTAEQALRFVHELRIHQQELEQQNEALRETRARLEASLRDVANLFDFAPIGYCVLDVDGTVRKANLAAAALLGVPRAALTGRPFVPFVAPPTRRAFAEFLERTGREDARQSCRVTVQRAGAPAESRRRQLRLEGQGSAAASGARQCLIALVDLTALERLHAERAAALADLRASEAQYRALVETTSGCLWEMDPQGRFTYLSPRFEDLSGYPPTAMVGKQPCEVFADSDLGRPCDALLTQFLCQECIACLQLRIRHRDTRLIDIEISAAPILGPDGERRGLRGMMYDIGERRRQEEARIDAARHASEQRLGALIEQGLAGVAELDLDGRFIRCNDYFCQLLGYSASQILGHSPREFIEPADWAATQALIERLLRGAPPAAIDLRYRRADGTLIHAQATAALISDDLGQPLAVLGLVNDITARKRMELELRRYRQIVEISTEKLLFVDRALRYRVVNPAYAALLRRTPAELQGQALTEALPPAIWTQFRPYLERALTVGASSRFRIEATYPDGIARYLEAEQQPFWEDGQIQGVVVSLHDLTAMRAAHTALERERAHLEERVAARTAELKAAQEAAEHASRAKSEFLAQMSHEIRTPMNAVLGLAQVLERTALGPDQRVMARRIHEAGRSLLAILNDILDLSKIEAERLHIDAQPFVLAPLLASVEDLLGLAASDKGLALTIAPAPALDGALMGDAHRLKQILVNLVGNAIKFTEHGEIRLTVDPLDVAPDRARLRFAVTDTGIGIPPDILDRLFAPFAQGDTGIARRFGGTGLGLAICKRLVERMGGIIGVESQVGAGSAFWCALPFARAAADAAAPPPVPADLPAAGPRLAGARLLVVDDSALNREVAERMLALEGARVTPAADGAAALALLRARPRDFDAVLMDVRMPVLDGLTATRRIRAELGLTALPIVALTAGAMPEQQAAARAAGMNDVLPKPIDLDCLVAMIRRQLRPGRPDPAPDPAAPVTDGPGRHGGSEPFPAIPGLDCDRAAALLGGNRMMFLRLLDQFMEYSGKLVEGVRSDLAAGRRQAAARRLHDLKGHAGTLGAQDIMVLARRLEAAIDGGAADLDADLSNLDHQLGQLNAAGSYWHDGPAPDSDGNLTEGTAR